jgi:hypothetical protein
MALIGSFWNLKDSHAMLNGSRNSPNKATGADGVKIAVLRKGRASLGVI